MGQNNRWMIRSNTELQGLGVWFSDGLGMGQHQLTSILTISSIDWFKGKIPGKSHTSWENLWLPVDFPLRQPIDTYGGNEV